MGAEDAKTVPCQSLMDRPDDHDEMTIEAAQVFRSVIGRLPSTRCRTDRTFNETCRF